MCVIPKFPGEGGAEAHALPFKQASGGRRRMKALRDLEPVVKEVGEFLRRLASTGSDLATD